MPSYKVEEEHLSMVKSSEHATSECRSGGLPVDMTLNGIVSDRNDKCLGTI